LVARRPGSGCGNNAAVIRRPLVSLLVLVMVLGLGLSGCGGGSGATVASFCTEVKKDSQEFKNLGGTKDAIDKASTALKELVRKSPSGVKDDVKTLSDAVEKAAAGDFA